LTYQQGTERLWYNSTRFDFYWPEFANLGEQAVLMREIYTLGTADDLNVWGYQEAWAHTIDLKTREFLDYFALTRRVRSTVGTYLKIYLHLHLIQRLLLIILQQLVLKLRLAILILSVIFTIRLFSARPMPMYSVPGLRRL